MIETVHPIAATKGCLWQIHKQVNGARQPRFSNSTECDSGNTRGADLSKLIWTVTSFGPPCDEAPFLPNPCKLETQGAYIRRDDGLGIYSGTFALTDDNGTHYYEGLIDLFDWVGTHHRPVVEPPHTDEECREHIEGWMAGRGVLTQPNLLRHHLRVAVSGRTLDSKPPNPPATNGDLVLIFNGTIFDMQ